LLCNYVFLHGVSLHDMDAINSRTQVMMLMPAGDDHGCALVSSIACDLLVSLHEPAVINGRDRGCCRIRQPSNLTDGFPEAPLPVGWLVGACNASAALAAPRCALCSFQKERDNLHRGKHV
jgi:hypothetical protein